MKISKKILISGLVICIIIASALISGCTTTISEEKDDSDKEEISKIPYVFPYDPEVLLPEVVVGNQSIWGSNVNLTEWYKLPYHRIFVEKYQNHSKEIIEIMKMQVALLAENVELFEKCLTGNKSDWLPTLGDPSLEYPEDFACILCQAWKGELNNYFGYNGTVWAFTSITRANGLITMETYYVNTTTFETLPFRVCTN